MNLKELTEQWLKTNGYEGLVNGSIECGCKLDDLMPCHEPGVDCEPGHVEECDGSCGRELTCEWHVVSGRRPAIDKV